MPDTHEEIPVRYRRVIVVNKPALIWDDTDSASMPTHKEVVDAINLEYPGADPARIKYGIHGNPPFFSVFLLK
jgi:hypothetical protein